MRSEPKPSERPGRQALNRAEKEAIAAAADVGAPHAMVEATPGLGVAVDVVRP